MCPTDKKFNPKEMGKIKAMESARKILYIEDNPANFRLVARLLHDEGFEVLHAPDGFQGVRKAIEEKDSLDLILMDINMPGMDGYEAATKLKTIQGFGSIPIIAITVNTLKGDRKRSIAAGCDGYIPKPIDIHCFSNQIKKYIKGKRERIQASEECYYLREHTQKLVGRLETSLGQLRLTHDQIQHKDKLASLGEMAARTAHELNNPLSSISFAVHLLMRDSAQGAPNKRHLDIINRNVQKIQRLAEGLTSFSRPSNAEPGLVDLPKAIDEALLLSEHEFRTREIKLELRSEEKTPFIWGSESQLHHVMVNLLRNAAHAVEARTKASEQPRQGAVSLEVAVHSNNYVCVRVTDNGTGIHPEYEERLFTPFFTTKPHGQGTGLGLFIVKEILDNMGGRIDVSSVLGEGTTFTVLLPRAPAASNAH